MLIREGIADEAGVLSKNSKESLMFHSGMVSIYCFRSMFFAPLLMTRRTLRRPHAGAEGYQAAVS
ncbi:hypothetical protein BN440_3453 [Erwinia amylovora MR1]|nr:hypothetical protein BN440_3453 [Erwinia amylovora MR1]